MFGPVAFEERALRRAALRMDLAPHAFSMSPNNNKGKHNDLSKTMKNNDEHLQQETITHDLCTAADSAQTGCEREAPL